MVQAKTGKNKIATSTSGLYEDPADRDTYITLGYLEEPKN